MIYWVNLQGRFKIDIHLVSFNVSSYFCSKHIRSSVFTVELTVPSKVLQIKGYCFTVVFYVFKSLTSHKQDIIKEM